MSLSTPRLSFDKPIEFNPDEHTEQMSLLELKNHLTAAVKRLKTENLIGLEAGGLYLGTASRYAFTKELQEEQNIVVRIITKICNFILGIDSKFKEFITLYNAAQTLGPGLNTMLVKAFEESRHKGAADILFQCEKNRMLSTNMTARGKEILKKSGNFIHIKAFSQKLAMVYTVEAQAKAAASSGLASFVGFVTDPLKSFSDTGVSAYARDAVIQNYAVYQYEDIKNRDALANKIMMEEPLENL